MLIESIGIDIGDATWSVRSQRRDFHSVGIKLARRRFEEIQLVTAASQVGGVRRVGGTGHSLPRGHGDVVEKVEGGDGLALLVAVPHEEVASAADDGGPRGSPVGRQAQDPVRLGCRCWRNQAHSSAAHFSSSTIASTHLHPRYSVYALVTVSTGRSWQDIVLSNRILLPSLPADWMPKNILKIT